MPIPQDANIDISKEFFCHVCDCDVMTYVEQDSTFLMTNTQAVIERVTITRRCIYCHSTRLAKLAVS
jgi:hypothetical protein